MEDVELCCPVQGCPGHITEPAVCSDCGPIRFFKVSKESIQRLSYERTVWAPTAKRAVEIVELGTAWPASYDERYIETISEGEFVTLDLTNTDHSKPYRDQANLPDGIYIRATKAEIKEFTDKGEANED